MSALHSLGIGRRATRPDWLLDGWSLICGMWREARPADRLAAVTDGQRRALLFVFQNVHTLKFLSFAEPLRVAVLAGLGAVDWVISFSEGTPENLLAEVKPDVLVKGGDYSVDQVVGADIVSAYGGKVKVLGLVENSSTTAIVEKIRNNE